MASKRQERAVIPAACPQASKPGRLPARCRTCRGRDGRGRRVLLLLPQDVVAHAPYVLGLQLPEEAQEGRGLLPQHFGGAAGGPRGLPVSGAERRGCGWAKGGGSLKVERCAVRREKLRELGGLGALLAALPKVPEIEFAMRKRRNGAQRRPSRRKSPCSPMPKWQGCARLDRAAPRPQRPLLSVLGHAGEQPRCADGVMMAWWQQGAPLAACWRMRRIQHRSQSGQAASTAAQGSRAAPRSGWPARSAPPSPHTAWRSIGGRPNAASKSHAAAAAASPASRRRPVGACRPPACSSNAAPCLVCCR